MRSGRTQQSHLSDLLIYIYYILAQCWIRVGLEVFIKKSRIAFLSSFPHYSCPRFLLGNTNTHPVQSARKPAAACSVLGTPPFCRYPRFLANKLKNSREFRKSGTLYWSMIWNIKSRCPEMIKTTLIYNTTPKPFLWWELLLPVSCRTVWAEPWQPPEYSPGPPPPAGPLEP